MAIDFGILERTPTIASRFMAGQEAARAEQERNMLLQQRQMEFQQAQENRLRAQQQDAQFEQMANLIREHGADPEDPQVLGKFAQAAFLSKQPQLASFVQSMMEHAAKRRQARAESEAVRGIMGTPTAALGASGVPAGATPTAAMPSAAPTVAPAAVAPPPPSLEERYLQNVSQALTERGFPPPKGAPTPALRSTTAQTLPVGEFAGVSVAAPVAEGFAEAMVPTNYLAPQPVNAMLAPPAAPAVQVAGPAALPTAAPKVDVAALETQLEGLQSKYDQLVALGTTAGNKAAATLKPQMDRISRQIERASKVTETAPAELRMMDALGIPRTEAGFARFNELKQRPEAMSSLARLIAERANLAPNDPSRKLYDDAIKKATTQPEGTKVEIYAPVPVVDPNDPSKVIYVSREEAIKGRLTPPSGMEGLTPQERQKREAEFPQAKQAVTTVSGTMSTIEETVDRLLKNKDGLDGITGLIYGRTPAVTDAARRADADIKQLRNLAFVQGLTELRAASKTGAGVGNVSNKEGDRFENLKASLDTTQSYADMVAALKRLKAQASATRSNLQTQFEDTYAYRQPAAGAAPAPAPAPAPSTGGWSVVR